MSRMIDVAVIGAGPYGLSLAAHLGVANLDVHVFGEPMQFWRDCMPEGMVLKSEGFASDLWHPDGALTLRDYCADQGLAYQRSGLPVPLQTFIDYGLAFQRRFVPTLDRRQVDLLDRRSDSFMLRLHDGETVWARRVVTAVGIGSFRYVPRELGALTSRLCSHSTEHRALGGFAGKRVLVIGGGASGVELAGLISQQGADVTVATRQDRIPYCNPPQPRGVLEKLRAPESGLGTGWRSLACVEAPMLFYRMPQWFRHMIVRRHLGPAPGWTAREQVERHVTTMPGATLNQAVAGDGSASVSFRMNDGTQQTVEVDHVIAATGFRVAVRRLRFISPTIIEKLTCAEFTPVLSPHFETSVPGLFMVGVAAANNFGPLLRFAYGAGFASRRLSGFLARTAASQPVSEPAARAAA